MTVADPCRVRGSARREHSAVVVDLMTLNGPLLVSNEAIVTGGRLEPFSFAEVGLPYFRIAPEPGVATVVLVVPAQCDGRSVRILVRLDVGRDGSNGEQVPLTVEDGGAAPAP